MGIATRWVAGSEEWVRAALLVSNRRYQRVLDQLQGLIVACMFELSKMNMSGTGEFIDLSIHAVNNDTFDRLQAT